MLQDKLKHKLILRQVPWRQQFFKDLELDFEIRLKEIEEIYPLELKRSQIISPLKSSFWRRIQENEILVTSDTIVMAYDKALGKPIDKQDALPF
jgi:septum formation protein